MKTKMQRFQIQRITALEMPVLPAAFSPIFSPTMFPTIPPITGGPTAPPKRKLRLILQFRLQKS